MVTTTTDANTWEGTSVDVAAIEKALGELWKRTGHQELADGRQLPVRTNVLNLVVHVPHDAGAECASDAVAGLIERHPSRTLIVVSDPDAPTSSLDAAVATKRTPKDAARCAFCWEQVTVTAHGAAALHAPGIIVPLLLPDLPTYLWWTDDIPFGSDLFTRMLNLCDRVIVDSALLARPIDGLSKLAALNRASARDRGVSDFHWLRLKSWRNLTAQFFDKTELRPYVQRIDSLRLTYARETDGGGIAQALLLAGWLASCLGWTPRPTSAWLKEGALHLEAARDGGNVVAIDIAPGDGAGAEAGDVLTLTLTATLRDVTACFSIDRYAQDDEATTTVKLDGAEGVAHRVRMATRGVSELLDEELGLFRHDRIYEDTLGAVAALCERVVTEERGP